MAISKPNILLLRDLAIGSKSLVAYSDLTGREVIAEGSVITQELLQSLTADGVSRVCVIDRTIEAEVASTSRLTPYSPVRLRQLQTRFIACEQLIDHTVERLRRGEVIFTRELEQQSEDYLNELEEDPDPVIAGVIAYQSDLTLARRCVQFSILSMSLAVAQSLPPKEIRELGVAAMMHDWSLFDMPPELRFPHTPKNELQRQDFLRHPIASEGIVNAIRGTTAVQQKLVGQVHELLDGSGYPRGLSLREIHPLSRVLSVAEAFLTLNSPPPGVARVMPCDAIAYLIAGASNGKFAPASVTALLQVVTMYPLGSLVELSDTTVVRVIRGQGSDYGYPIVQSLANPDLIIDLRHSDLFITRPVPASDCDEVRLPDAYKELNTKMT
jgi:HD-GYP domain-containing protein (c-di-GMP phosphodiesterase class II)